MLDICLLGCGGMMPLPKRWLTSLLIRYKGKMILIDCGEGTQIPIKISKWGFKAIDVICFTHYHGDHILGLTGLLLTIGNSGREEPLTLFGPPGLSTVVEGLTVVSPQLPFSLQIVELSMDHNNEVQFGDMKIKSQPVDHNISCLAYSVEIERSGKFIREKAEENNIPIELWSRLQKGEVIEQNGIKYFPEMVLGEERKGLKLSYCTDSRPTEELMEFATESDLLICEGMYGDDEMIEKAKSKKHMIFSEAALIARNAKVKELWLTHYSPSLEYPEEYLEKAKIVFENTKLGKDLMFGNLKFNS